MCIETLSNNSRITQAAAVSLPEQQNALQAGVGPNKFSDSGKGKGAVSLNAPWLAAISKGRRNNFAVYHLLKL